MALLWLLIFVLLGQLTCCGGSHRPNRKHALWLTPRAGCYLERKKVLFEVCHDSMHVASSSTSPRASFLTCHPPRPSASLRLCTTTSDPNRLRCCSRQLHAVVATVQTGYLFPIPKTMVGDICPNLQDIDNAVMEHPKVGRSAP